MQGAAVKTAPDDVQAKKAAGLSSNRDQGLSSEAHACQMAAHQAGTQHTFPEAKADASQPNPQAVEAAAARGRKLTPVDAQANLSSHTRQTAFKEAHVTVMLVSGSHVQSWLSSTAMVGGPDLHACIVECFSAAVLLSIAAIQLQMC